MISENQRQELEKIENYILGRLDGEEIENLWEEFINKPELYNHFEIQLMIRYLGKEKISEV